MALQLPYVSACCQANHYYKLFISWTNQNIRNTFVQRNMFDFKHIKVIPLVPLCVWKEEVFLTPQPFDRSYIDNPGPMVVFATPGMLHAGLSLQIFKKWAEDEKNMVQQPLPPTMAIACGLCWCAAHHAWLLCGRDSGTQGVEWSQEDRD